MPQIIDRAVDGIVGVVEKCGEPRHKVRIQPCAPRLKISPNTFERDRCAIYGDLIDRA